MLKELGMKTGSKVNNPGSINLLLHSCIDYKIGLMDKENYCPAERITLQRC
jgi:hypothetical protein